MKFAAVILAGGKSRRMGKNKAWLPLGGRRVIDVIAERMTGFEEVFVSSDIPQEVSGCINIEDIHKDCGPAAGILTALKTTSADAVFVTACDMPLIKRNTIERLCGIFDGRKEAVVLKTDGGLEPLFAVYGKKTAALFEAAIAEGELSVRKIIDKMDAAAVAW